MMKMMITLTFDDAVGLDWVNRMNIFLGLIIALLHTLYMLAGSVDSSNKGFDDSIRRTRQPDPIDLGDHEISVETAHSRRHGLVTLSSPKCILAWS
jgi:hypothetical protein